jgi:hypothetical protein
LAGYKDAIGEHAPQPEQGKTGTTPELAPVYSAKTNNDDEKSNHYLISII